MNHVESTSISAAGLGQLDRIASTFTAPSRTFEDIRNGHRSWWLPFILISIVSYLLFAAVVQRVGLEQTVQNQFRFNPRAQEQMAQASPEQLQRMTSISVSITEDMFIASPAVSLLYVLIISAVFFGTINFGFGGRARFADVFAVSWYAWLPIAIQMLMGMVVMWLQPPDNFNIKNFAPTNPAALFLDPASSSQTLYAFLSQIDVITIWTLVLLSIGVSTVAGIKRSGGYITVFGWWIILVFFKVATAAVFS
jgi:hypothetical protein